MIRLFNIQHRLVFLLVFLAGQRAVAADQIESQAIQPTQNYCGLYALYGAAIHEGKSIDFALLLKHKYMGCSKGSSMQELQQAALDYGLYTLPINAITPKMLRTSGKPVILFVRSDLSVPNYDHYILYLRCSDGVFVCLDNDHLISLSEPELMTRWSGAGMMVSATELGSVKVLMPAWVSSASWLLFPLGIVFSLRSIGQIRKKRLGRGEALLGATSIQFTTIALAARGFSPFNPTYPLESFGPGR